MKNKVAFIIPYFGRIPPYFDIWQKTALANPDFDFFFLTNVNLPIPPDSNIKRINMSFASFVNRAKAVLGNNIVLDRPYKICDYKPTFGLIFEEELSAYDFWGFCDVDLVFGNLSHFITDDLLDQYDKLFMHGHFSLHRNCSNVNRAFLREFKTVLNHQYAFSTRFSCHFDENGTLAYADKYMPDIRTYYEGTFFDPNYRQYQLMYQGAECCGFWDNGNLYLLGEHLDSPREIMYLHLQKRDMTGTVPPNHHQFHIVRTSFVSEKTNEEVLSFISTPPSQDLLDSFSRKRRKRRIRAIITSLKTGTIRFRIHRYLNRWESR